MRVNPSSIQSYHDLVFRTSERYNGRDLYYISISGIAICHLQGRSREWLRDELIISSRIPLNRIPVEGTPPRDHYPLYVAREWTVLTTLNAIGNSQSSIVGHAVDSSDITNPNRLTDNRVGIHSIIASRDANATLYRVGYKADFLIYFNRFEPDNLI